VIKIDLPEVAKQRGRAGAKLPPAGPTLACEISVLRIMMASIKMAEKALRENVGLFGGIKAQLSTDAASLGASSKRALKGTLKSRVSRSKSRASGRSLLVRGPSGEAWWTISEGLRRGAYKLAGPAKDPAKDSAFIGDTLSGFDLFMANLRAALDHSSKMAQGKVAQAYAQEERRHRTGLGKSIQSRYGFSMDEIFSDRDVAAQVGTAIQKSVSLITGLNDELAKKVEFTVLDAAQKGETKTILSQRLRKEMGITKNRAMLIASDQVASLNATLNRVRHEQVGVDKYVWETMMDDRVRPDHEERQGRVFSWDDPPWDGNPGEAINCFLGQTTIRSQSNIEHLFRHSYGGEATTIVVESGKPLEATANHPVLTKLGWKLAKFIDVGDDLIQTSFCRGNFLEMDVEQREPKIGDLFDLVSSIGGQKASGRIGRDFHGDLTVDEQIDVVSPDRFLSLNSVPSLNKDLAKSVLESSLVGFVHLSGRSDLEPLLVASLVPSHGLVGIASELCSFLWAQLLHPDPVCLGYVADWKTESPQLLRHGASCNSDGLLHGQGALTKVIPPDKFILIEWLRVVSLAARSLDGRPSFLDPVRKPSSAIPDLSGCVLDGKPLFDVTYSQVKEIIRNRRFGHVYNLQTGSSWYLAQNHLVSNCRCVAAAYVG
jgi:SPP1 gp7 family putative phage head morphogenesis protein